MINLLCFLISDSEGWLDVLGSGRLKKRTVVEGVTSAAKPRNGQVVKIHKKGEVAFNTSKSKTVNHFMDVFSRFPRPTSA